MTNTVFPYKAWVLQPSFKPVEVVFYKSGGYKNEWLYNENKKPYHFSEVFPTKQEAIAYGYKKLQAHEARLTKQQETIEKRRATLKKHEA